MNWQKLNLIASILCGLSQKMFIEHLSPRLGNKNIKKKKKLHPNVAMEISRNNHRAVVSLIAAKRLVIKALQVCKECAGSLLRAVRAIKHVQNTGKNDFGEDLHTLHSKPHFYDASYKQTDRKDPIPIDGNGRCIINEVFERERNSKGNTLKWKCSSKCKLTESEVNAILDLKAEFEDPMHEV